MNKQTIAIVLLVLAILFSVASIIVSMNADTGFVGTLKQGITYQKTSALDGSDAESANIGVTVVEPPGNA